MKKHEVHLIHCAMCENVNAFGFALHVLLCGKIRKAAGHNKQTIIALRWQETHSE